METCWVVGLPTAPDGECLHVYEQVHHHDELQHDLSASYSGREGESEQGDRVSGFQQEIS
jgi:hypothetical protein